MTNQEQYELICEKAKKYDRLVGILDKIRAEIEELTITEGGDDYVRSMNCEDCDYADIADWEPNGTTEKVRPVYWCERYKKMCSNISECRYKIGSEDT